MEQQQNPSIGYLIVNVSTARGAIPLEGASVTVFDADEPSRPIITSILTDSSGKSARIALEAPNRELAMSPGNAKPYATYTIETVKEGYYTVTNSGVPIFAGITSIQPIEMLPLAEYDPENVFPIADTEIDEDEAPGLG